MGQGMFLFFLWCYLLGDALLDYGLYLEHLPEAGFWKEEIGARIQFLGARLKAFGRKMLKGQ